MQGTFLRHIIFLIKFKRKYYHVMKFLLYRFTSYKNKYRTIKHICSHLYSLMFENTLYTMLNSIKVIVNEIKEIFHEIEIIIFCRVFN